MQTDVICGEMLYRYIHLRLESMSCTRDEVWVGGRLDVEVVENLSARPIGIYLGLPLQPINVNQPLQSLLCLNILRPYTCSRIAARL